MSVEDAHDLMPPEIAKDIPPLGATSEEVDPLVHVKWFTPDAQWTWFVIEYDPAERIAYGFVIGLEREYGTFPLDEILSVRGPWGLRAERDLYFKTKRISLVLKQLK